jgi:hypothetical protein
MPAPTPILTLSPTTLLGQAKAELGSAAPLKDAKWYTAANVGDGLSYTFEPGALAKAQTLLIDLLLDGHHLAVFQLALHEPPAAGPDDKPLPPRVFTFSFGLLNQCAARLRLPLKSTDQNQWAFYREGACLKRMAGGDRVDPAKVVRITLTVLRKAPGQPVRFAATSLVAASNFPDAIYKPLLPKGKLLDELGQSTLHDWPAKTRSVEECTSRLKQQLADAPKQSWPQQFNQWGGSATHELRTRDSALRTGFFRTHHDGHRWWLLDPEGKPFWSAGLDVIAPVIDTAYAQLESALSFLPNRTSEFKSAYSPGRQQVFNYLAANFIRAFGPDKWRGHWATITLSLLRQCGFNTIGNWSDWKIAPDARFPYVRPLSFRPRQTKDIYRDFPDVFSPTFDADAADFAKQLEPTRDDPALIGYFLMNEPTWGFATEPPAAGMLYTHDSSHSRGEFATWLAEKYKGDPALAEAWKIPGLTLARIAGGKWDPALRLPPAGPGAAQSDCFDFSTLMVRRLFETLTQACKKTDPNHLNLGARYHTTPPPWALRGMNSFDVFSINCYQDRVPQQPLATIEATVKVPTLIGEYHFGALDVGLPASGIGHVASQADRGKAFRVYTEHAAALPQCVGVHYFTLYDQSAVGRFDGENYQIGFADTCNRPYDPLAAAARQSHERLYEVASGKVEPFNEVPKYLPKLF